MIQVCSACGTRWNVREKQRLWCPRCQGALLPPDQTATTPASADPGWRRPGAAAGTPATGTPGKTAAAAPAGQLPPGYRWIAVRPGSPPRLRQRRRHQSPTPRYEIIPRWSLPDPVPLPSDEAVPPAQVSAEAVRRVLDITAITFGVAAFVYLLRYVLLIINRHTLLHPLIAGSAVVLGIIASLAAIAMVIICWLVLTRWLIERRAAVYSHRGLQDPRTRRELWAGCLTPLANLFWAPVFVLETATAEGLYSRLRKSIVVWWLWWALSAVVCSYAVVSMFTFDWRLVAVVIPWADIALNTSAQGIADNTLVMIYAYLVGVATVLALARVYRGFQDKPVERQGHRWLAVGEPAATAPSAVAALSAVAAPSAVEKSDREPAA